MKRKDFSIARAWREGRTLPPQQPPLPPLPPPVPPSLVLPPSDSKSTDLSCAKILPSSRGQTEKNAKNETLRFDHALTKIDNLRRA